MRVLDEHRRGRAQQADCFARQVFIAAFVPWALRLAHQFDPSYVYRNGEPQFIAAIAVGPLALIPAAIVLDLTVRRQRAAGGVWSSRHWLRAGLFAALPLIALAPILVRGAARGARGQLPPGLTIPQFALLPAFLVAVPLALIVAALAIRIGDGWGTILRLNDR